MVAIGRQRTFATPILMNTTPDLLVYRQGQETVVADENTRAKLHSSTDAAAAIQHALALAQNGGTVMLASGVWLLDRPLRLMGGATLAGRGHGTVLAAADAFAGDAAVIIEDAHAATLRNLTVSGFVGPGLTQGVILRRSPQCVLESVSVGGVREAGFLIEDNSFLSRVHGCIAAGNTRCGFLLRNNFKGTYGDFVPISVQDSLVYGGGKGFEFDRCIVANITGCSVYQTGNTAFHLYNMSNSVLISGCRTFQIGGDAYVSEESNEINLTGNIFCWHEGVGIRLRKVCWGTISCNNIIDTGSYNPNAPDCSVTFAEVGNRARPHEAIIMEESRGLVVSSNAIFNWHVCPPLAHAIREDEKCADNTYVGNNINYVAPGAEAILAAAKGGASIANNTVHAAQPHVHYYGQQTLLPPDQQKMQSFQPAITRKLIETIFGRPAAKS